MCVESEYFTKIEDSVFALSDGQKESFGNGSGQELLPRIVRGKTRPPKMCAVHSSSALAVNMLGPFSESVKSSSFWNEVFNLGRFFVSDVTGGTFERKMRVNGVSGFCPNLDFFIQGDDCVVGVESKYREMYTRHHNQHVQKQYFDKFDWDEYPELRSAAESVNAYSRLGASQLIKHALSLISSRKKFRLVYIYHPIENKIVKKEHDEELRRFRDESGLGWHFVSLTYTDYMRRLLNHPDILPPGYVEFVKKRYPYLLEE